MAEGIITKKADIQDGPEGARALLAQIFKELTEIRVMTVDEPVVVDVAGQRGLLLAGLAGDRAGSGVVLARFGRRRSGSCRHRTRQALGRRARHPGWAGRGSQGCDSFIGVNQRELLVTLDVFEVWMAPRLGVCWEANGPVPADGRLDARFGGFKSAGVAAFRADQQRSTYNSRNRRGQ